MWHVAVYCVSGCTTSVITVVDDLAAVYYFKGSEREGTKGRGEKGGRRGIAPENISGAGTANNRGNYHLSVERLLQSKR